ncbi:hypothetical protein GS397_10460 [Sphingobium yanoikuyae]|uniref:Uncharacterized protein n=1 Tax=Sphingobium yanoikuyae TaxID=13690 RepID=A0A6P1GGT7_SPHYA|nr:hypothetical protein [Sphingobium yanoikuyae]QHD67433.1 hypothetical protein GS397_10460 [Sphingobium yanoikuyae]
MTPWECDVQKFALIPEKWRPIIVITRMVLRAMIFIVPTVMYGPKAAGLALPLLQ